METKGKSENQNANLEMVLESISEDLRTNAGATSKLLGSIENLSQKIDHLGSDENERKGKGQDFSKEMKIGFDKISESISKNTFSIDRLQQPSEVSQRNNQQQKTAPETKVIHHHHISKGIWVAVILFICLSLESVGWFNTVNKLDQYIENDTKYRFMKLDTATKNLQVYLDSLDARYKSDPDMHDMVIKLEDQYRKNIERLEKAERLKREAKDLENKVHIK